MGEGRNSDFEGSSKAERAKGKIPYQMLEVVIPKLYCYHNSLTSAYHFIFFKMLSSPRNTKALESALNDNFTKYIFSNSIYK